MEGSKGNCKGTAVGNQALLTLILYLNVVRGRGSNLAEGQVILQTCHAEVYSETSPGGDGQLGIAGTLLLYSVYTRTSVI